VLRNRGKTPLSACCVTARIVAGVAPSRADVMLPGE
jgi:hypothetical protein